MAWYDSLIEQGAVPAGATPKVYNPMTGQPEFQPSGAGGKIARAISMFVAQQQEQQQERMKRLEQQSSMYNTLRDSGYEPKAAHEAVMKSRFPAEPGTASKKEAKEAAELKQTEAQTAKTEAETAEIKGGKATSYDRLKARILSKIANDESLTAGEQKVYDEVIRKERGDLESVLTGAAPEPSMSPDMVPVTAPDGAKGFVPKAKLAAALKKGYKRR